VTPRAILFDFYGTLVDVHTDEQPLAPWQVLASWLSYRSGKFDACVLRQTYFDAAQRRLDESTEEHPDVDVVAIFAAILRDGGGDPADALPAAQLLRSLTIEHWRVYEESPAVVSALAERFPLALISDSQEPYLLPELRRSGLAEHFGTIVVSSRYGYRKPDARLFRVALDQLGIAPSEAVYVGNSWERDVIGARNAGVRPILIERDHDGGGDGGIEVLRDLRGLLRFAQ